MLLFVCNESTDCFLRYDPYEVQQAISQDTQNTPRKSLRVTLDSGLKEIFEEISKEHVRKTLQCRKQRNTQTTFFCVPVVKKKF